MGSYNYLCFDKDPDDSELESCIQFKWGDRRFYKYRIGDTIKHDWSDDDPTAIVTGISDRGYYRIQITEWVIVSLTEITQEEYDAIEWLRIWQ